MPSTDIDGSPLVILGLKEAAVIKEALNNVRPAHYWTVQELMYVDRVRGKIKEAEDYEHKRNATV